MRYGLLAMAALAMTSPAQAKDGFFEAKDRARVVKLRVTKTHLTSLDNFNRAFRLTLTTPWGPEAPPMVMVVGGQTFRNDTRGSSQGRERSYTFSHIPAEHVAAVARLAKVKPVRREHPGYLIATRFDPDKPAYTAGDPVAVTLTIRNVGKVPLSLMAGGRQRGARDNQFAFAGHRDRSALVDIGDPTHFGGRAQRITLAPGEELTRRVDLGKWFDVSKPGHYALTASYYFEVVPKDGYRTLWVDHATAELYFRVTAK